MLRHYTQITCKKIIDRGCSFWCLTSISLVFIVCLEKDGYTLNNICRDEHDDSAWRYFTDIPFMDAGEILRSNIAQKGARNRLRGRGMQKPSITGTNVSSLKRNLTAIRISGHCLPIEYLRKKGIERDKRYCDLCDENKFGTEQHVMVDCKNKELVKLREQLKSKLLKLITSTHNFPPRM